jgi:hypothetical protein
MARTLSAGLIGSAAALTLAVSVRAGDMKATLTPAPTPLILIERFRLFPELALVPLPFSTQASTTRPFHQQGDPDSLFTFGGATRDGEVRLKAAFEISDVVLRAIAPDLRVDPSDTRPRAAGDYRALDARGRPYQLRLGARLVW